MAGYLEAMRGIKKAGMAPGMGFLAGCVTGLICVL